MPDRADQYDLTNPKHRKDLDLLSVDAIIDLFGEPVVRAEWDTPHLRHWQPGDERPALADDDPAVQQAIGRCTTTRAFRAMGTDVGPIRDAISAVHPRECGWCHDTLEELLAVCDWATFQGRTQTAEWLIWSRDGSAGGYSRRLPMHERSQRYAEFWALSAHERNRRIERAQYGVAVPA